MAIKLGLDFFPPVLFAAIRYDIAGALMLAYAIYATDHWRPRGRGEWGLVAVGGALMIAAYHAFLFIGELETTSAIAAIIVSLSPILTTGFARVLLPSERLTPASIFGLLLGLLGVVILAQPDPSNLVTESAVGQALVFTAGAAFALGSVLTRRIDAHLPIETMEAWSMLLGAALMHGLSAVRPVESFAMVQWTVEGIAALLYLSVASSAIGFLIYFDLLERLGPIEINLVSYVAPIFAAVSGWLFLGETVGLNAAVGFLVIFTGFCIVKRRALAEELPQLQTMLGK